MKLSIWLAFAILMAPAFPAQGANILVFIGMGSYSHRVPLQPLLDAMADRGHNVTILSGFPPKVPNPKIKELVTPKLFKWIDDLMHGGKFDAFGFRKNSQILAAWLMNPVFGVEACESLYTDPEYLAWMTDPTTKVDVVIFDALVNECAYGIAHYFKAKVVSFNTGQMYPWNLESHYGLPDESSSIPDGMLHLPVNMNFFQRVLSALNPLAWKVYREYWFFPKLEEITKKGLGLDSIPSFKEIEQNTSLYLLNSHWAPEFPRSLPPNVIPIGGVALKEKKANPLPKKLEDFINKGKEGFIFVSFGTVAEFTRFDPEVRQAFIGMLNRFPNIQFILKSTFPVQEKLPSNVLVDKWLPQADILVHPKIRVFVTHGGLGGFYEAINSKVPMICFPIFAEQEFNANLMEHKGYGIKLELTTLKEHEIADAIGKILGNPSYKKRVETVAKFFANRPISALDNAVWWLEFIINNENTNEFIRPLSATQSWWVRRQLDVWAFVLLTAVLISCLALVIVYSIIKLFIGMICGGSKPQGKSKSKRAKID